MIPLFTLRADMHKFPVFLVTLVLASVLSACSFSLAADITPPPGSEQQAAPQTTLSAVNSPVYPIVPPDPVNGAAIYAQECASCHGSKGLGDGPQSSQLSVPASTLGLSDFARQFSPAEWYAIVTQGDLERFMPPFSNLTDRQRWDVIAYALTLGAPSEVVTQGEALYQENCLRCHGEKGRGNGADAATLSSLPRDFADQSFMADQSAASLYQSITAGVAPDMPAYNTQFSESERWALVDYLRSLTFAIHPPVAAYPYPAPLAAATVAPLVNASPEPGVNSYPGPEAYPPPAPTQSIVPTSTAELTQTASFIGSVTVQLINGSGGDAPSDAPVTLYGFDSMQNTFSETLTSGVNGVYTFTNIEMLAERVFLAGVDFAGGTYGSDIITVDPATPDLKLPITVYDSTTDTSVLTNDRVHIFFDFTDPKNVQVVEVFIISNPSNKAIVAAEEGGTVVTFPLPTGYTNLQFQDGELGGRYVEVSQGFADKMTVNPGAGNYQVIFAFQIPYNRKVDFLQPLSLPTSAVVVMVPDSGVKVTSDQFQDGGVRDFQGTPYHMYNGSSFIGGSSLEFTVSGFPKQTGTGIRAGTVQSLAIGLGVFGIVLVLGGLWLYRRNRLIAAGQEVGEGVATLVSPDELDITSDDPDTLMDAIIALDDQYKAGNLPEAAYLERRAELKEKLSRLTEN